MSENLGDFLLKERIKNKDKMQKGLKTTYIGEMGELFALNYLKKLFKRNNIKNDIFPHNDYHDDYDLEIYINGRKYKIEVKTSTAEKHPAFFYIHFNNNFDYLLLIWHPNDEEIYLAILTKDEARRIAIPMNAEREDEDNWQIYAPEYFEETNKNFLNRLSIFLKLNEELEDLEDDEKIELIENVKEQIIKTHKDAEINDFAGEVYQQWFYEYLSNYSNEVEAKPNGDDYDIKYKEKHIEVKYSSLHDDGNFKFKHIKSNLFEFIFLIGFDKKENKFYFSIKTSDEIVKIKRELAGTDEFFSQNGFDLHVGKHSIVNFVNDFTFEDFDNYIETH